MNLSEIPPHELRVPVSRTKVEVRTERGKSDGVVFLPPGTSPEELFEGDSLFFPVEESGQIRLYARSAVVSIVVDADDSPPESLELLGVTYQVRLVTVRLRSGDALTGTITWAPGIGRTLDLLNQPAKSFSLRAEGKIHHVAKTHVEHIEEQR